jgi:hypothetical protein
MDHAIFTPAGDPLARFIEDEVDADPEYLAERALAADRLRYGPGAYVDALCPMHDTPRSDCGPCETQQACNAGDWPEYTCPAHR